MKATPSEFDLSDQGISRRWLSVSEAARYLDVSEDTVSRRGIPWQGDPVTGKLRFKVLNLGGSKKDRRYPIEDCDRLLETP